MSAQHVKDIPALIFDALEKVFPNTPSHVLSTGFDPLFGITGRFESIFFDDQSCALLLGEDVYLSRLFFARLPEGNATLDVHTRLRIIIQNPTLLIAAGFFRTDPKKWVSGKGYQLHTDVRMMLPLASTSLLEPGSEILAYLIAHTSQIIGAHALVSTTAHEVDICPGTHYSQLPGCVSVTR